MSEYAGPETSAAPVRPPDFLLPKGAPGTPRARTGEPEIYLSWGGNIYGPAGSEEVLAGVRTSWFEPDTLFWFEGQTDWLPVEEFPGLVDGGYHTLAARRIGAAPEDAPPLPAAGASPALRTSRGHRRRGSGRNRKGKSKAPRRHGRSSKLGRLIVFFFVLLAVVVTVGLIFLLMQF